MSFSYEEWKKKDNNRKSKRPLTKVPKFDDWKAKRPSQRVEERKPYGGTSIEQFRFDAQPKTDKARQADADRFARGHKDFRASARDVANQLDAQGPQSDKAKKADDERFAGRYKSEQSRVDKQKDIARKADTDRYAKQYKVSPKDIANQQAIQAPKSAKAKEADAARFGGGYQRKDEQPKRKPDIARTYNRDSSPSLFTNHVDLPGVDSKKENKPSIVSRALDTFKRVGDDIGATDALKAYTPKGISKLDEVQAFINPDNKNDSFLEKRNASLRLAAGDITESTGEAINYLTRKTNWAGIEDKNNPMIQLGNKMQEKGEGLREGFEDTTYGKPFTKDSLTDEDWYATSFTRAFPTAVSSFIPSITVAKVLGNVNKIAKLPKLYKAIIQTVGGATANTAYDSAVLSGGIYEEALKRGMTEKEALNAADKAFGQNFALTGVTSAVELGAGLLPFGKGISKLAKGASIAGRTTLGAATEGFQEGAQTGIEANALGDEFKWTDPSTIEAMVIGAIMGGGFSGITATHNALTDTLTKKPGTDNPVEEILNRAVDELPPEIRQEFDQAVNEQTEQGMPHDDAVKIVAEQLINRVPEFQSVIETVAKDYIDNKKLEQQSKESNPITQEQEELEKVQTNPEIEINPSPKVQPEMDIETSLDVPNVPQGIPNVPNNVIAPPTFETPVQASKEPLDVQVGDSISLQGTRPETEYVVEGVEGNSVTLQTPNKKTIKVPKSQITNVLNRKAIEEALSDEVDYDYDADNMFDDDVEQSTSDALPPNFRKDLRADLYDMVNNEGATIDEAVAGLKSDEYYADNPEWQKLIEEEAKAFGYKGEVQAEPQQETKAEAEAPTKATKPINFKVEQFEPKGSTDEGISGVASDDGTLTVRVFRSTTQEGLDTMAALGFRFSRMEVVGPGKAKWFEFTKPSGKTWPEVKAEMKKIEEAIAKFKPGYARKYGSKFEVGDTVYQANATGEPHKGRIKSKDSNRYEVEIFLPHVSKNHIFYSPFNLPEADQDLYADKTEAENESKVRKQKREQEYHDYITGKDSGREPIKAELITPIGKNEKTGRPTYKYNLVGKKWVVIPLNAPRTVNGEQNAKKAYLHLERGIGTLHVGGDASVIQDMGTIYIGAGKSFKWEGKNISDVFPDIPEYNSVLFADMKNYLEGEDVQFTSKLVQDERKAELEAKADKAKDKMFEEGDPNEIFNRNKDEWNKEPFKPTHQRKIKTLNKVEQWQVVEFESAKGTFFVRRSENVPYINPAPISMLSNVLEPLSEVEPETPSAKKPPLTAIDKSKPFPKVKYKEAATRITATFKPVKKYWDKEEPVDMTLIFPKDKDGFLGMPKHDGRSASVTDVNDWLNINYYQEGVTAKELTETFDFMNNTQEDEIVYSKDYTHELIHKGVKIKTFFRPDGMVHWIDEYGNTGKSVTSPAHVFRAVKIPTGEEKKKQDAKEAEIAETIKKNYSFDPFDGFPRGLFTTGTDEGKKGHNDSWSHEQARQYRLNEQTILSLMSDEDVLNYAAVDYASGTYRPEPDNRAYGDMELTEKWYRDKMKNYGSANQFISNDSPYGFKNKVRVKTGDGRELTATYNEMWKRYKGLLEGYNAKNGTPKKAESEKLPSPPKQEAKAPKEAPTNVKADDKYAKMRDRLEFTEKAAAAARKRLAERKGRLLAGLPMDDMVDYTIIGLDILAHKMVDMAEFTETMVKEFGESVRIWIPGIYGQSIAALDYNEEQLKEMLQGAYNDDSMTLIEEETTTSIEEPTNGETNTKLQEYEALMDRIQAIDAKKTPRTKAEDDARNELVQQGWKLAEEVPHWGFDVGEVVERELKRGWKRDTILEIDKGQVEFKSVSVPYTMLRKVAIETETKPETNATSEYASLGYLEPKPQKRSARNGQFTTDEIIMFDLLGDTEIPSFLKAIFAESDPRLVNDLYIKLMVSRGREVKIDGKEFNKRFNASSDLTIGDYRQNLLGYGRGLDEDGEQFQVLLNGEGTVYVSYSDPKQKSIEMPYSEFEEAMSNDEYSFGYLEQPDWIGNVEGFLDEIRKRQGGGKNVSNIIGTGSVPNGAPTESTQNADGGKPTSEVSAKGEGRPEGSSERTNDGIADGVPDSRDGQPEGSTGDTITSPSNHGNPTERVVPVDHVITENIYEPSPKKRSQ